MPYGLPWSEAFIRQLSDKATRAEFVADQVRTRIALSIRALRDQGGRGWSQAELGRRMDKPQSTVSRLEDIDYGKASLQTLLEVAEAFDLPLMVEFPEWDDWARRMADMRAQSLCRTSFDVERLAAQAKAAAESCAEYKQVVGLKVKESPRETGTARPQADYNKFRFQYAA